MRLSSDVSSRVSNPHLRRAFELALRGHGTAAPNPPVGCVIVRDGATVGEGYHPRAGEPHAEIFALRDAGKQARGADAYVTLEPCRHHGRTAPCTDALIAAGIKRVVIGCADPTQQAGGGSEVLRAAGIDVSYDDDPVPFETLVEGWRSRSLRGRPFVTVKVALSLDGRLALQRGQRAALSGEAGGHLTGELRSKADAVLVGASTVAIDDPALTARGPSGGLLKEQPLRVVLSRTTVPAPDVRMFTDGAAPTLLLIGDAVGESALRPLPAHVLVERYDATIGVGDALSVLAARGVNELLVEAGPTLLTALWSADLVDQLITVTAGGMAGSGAPELYVGLADTVQSSAGTDDFGAQALAHRFAPVEASIVGDVVVAAWRPASSTQVSSTHDRPSAPSRPIT